MITVEGVTEKYHGFGTLVIVGGEDGGKWTGGFGCGRCGRSERLRVVEAVSDR